MTSNIEKTVKMPVPPTWEETKFDAQGNMFDILNKQPKLEQENLFDDKGEK